MDQIRMDEERPGLNPGSWHACQGRLVSLVLPSLHHPWHDKVSISETSAPTPPLNCIGCEDGISPSQTICMVAKSDMPGGPLRANFKFGHAHSWLQPTFSVPHAFQLHFFCLKTSWLQSWDRVHCAPNRDEGLSPSIRGYHSIQRMDWHRPLDKDDDIYSRSWEETASFCLLTVSNQTHGALISLGCIVTDDPMITPRQSTTLAQQAECKSPLRQERKRR